MLSNHAAVERFRDGKTGHSGNIIAERDALLSYGRHWPLAVRLPAHDKADPRHVLLNGDRYHRPTTNQHASITFRAFPNSPRVSFSALREAGVARARGWSDESIIPEAVRVVSHTRDLFWDLYLTKEPWQSNDVPRDVSWENFFEKLPPGAVSGEEKKDGRPYRRWAHRIGCVVLRYNGADYLSGMDEGNYFLVRLPHPVRTVDGAFLALQPAEVRKAYKDRLDVLRQGEWFFIPAGGQQHPQSKAGRAGIRLSRMVGPYHLPRKHPQSNIHAAGKVMLVPGTRPWRGLYVAGMVRHLDPHGEPARVSWGRRVPALHRPLRLPKGMIYRAVENTATGSWSARGLGVAGVD